MLVLLIAIVRQLDPSAGGPVLGAAAAIGTLLGVTALLTSWRGVRGTTLVAPWCWAWSALTVVATTELAVAFTGLMLPPGAPLRYGAAVVTFAPLMAMLGAKRPQDRAWQFIVLSLLVVLLVPAIQSWVQRGAAPVALHLAWSGFLLLLVIVGMGNYLPTRFWLPAMLYALGQLLLVADYLPWLALPWPAWHAPGGFVLAATAMLVAALLPRRSKLPAMSLGRLWIDFRNTFGAVWGLRVAERFNAASQAHGWNVTLTWQGFHAGPASGPVTDTLPLEARNHLRTIMRRFVSAEWIAERWREA